MDGLLFQDDCLRISKCAIAAESSSEDFNSVYLSVHSLSLWPLWDSIKSCLINQRWTCSLMDEGQANILLSDRLTEREVMRYRYAVYLHAFHLEATLALTNVNKCSFKRTFSFNFKRLFNQIGPIEIIDLFF